MEHLMLPWIGAFWCGNSGSVKCIEIRKLPENSKESSLQSGIICLYIHNYYTYISNICMQCTHIQYIHKWQFLYRTLSTRVIQLIIPIQDLKWWSESVECVQGAIWSNHAERSFPFRISIIDLRGLLFDFHRLVHDEHRKWRPSW